MKRTLIGLALIVGGLTAVSGQAALDARVQAQLKQLFPGASSFSPKQNDPPHYKAYSGDPKNAASVIGVAFWTTDLTPLERGYDGPIKVLVGMTMQGVLTGIVVADHHEPFGNFSIDTAGFQAQFRNKDIRDGFVVGRDIDAVTRATISITTVSRSVRNGARRLARAILTPPSATQ